MNGQVRFDTLCVIERIQRRKHGKAMERDGGDWDPVDHESGDQQSMNHGLPVQRD
jgi:hypothetical protein